MKIVVIVYLVKSINDAKEAQEILQNSGMAFLVASNLQDAANKVTEALNTPVEA